MLKAVCWLFVLSYVIAPLVVLCVVGVNPSPAVENSCHSFMDGVRVMSAVVVMMMVAIRVLVRTGAVKI